jgi:hypothetical protein
LLNGLFAGPGISTFYFCHQFFFYENLSFSTTKNPQLFKIFDQHAAYNPQIKSLKIALAHVWKPCEIVLGKYPCILFSWSNKNAKSLIVCPEICGRDAEFARQTLGLV